MNSYTITLPKYVSDILGTLEQHGYEAYAIGGAVRDIIMNRVPDDYDITTNASPDEVSDIFSVTHKVVDIGKKFGTVIVVCNEGTVEITTYRTDNGYSDNRRPDSVTFSSRLSEDLSRRDFTVNAIAYNKTSVIVDKFDGVNDIDSKVVRCIGNPTERFSEDALRVLRAMRFSAKLDFDISAETAHAANADAHLLKNISAERVFSELYKLFSARGTDRLLKILTNFKPVLSVIFPELSKLTEYSGFCCALSQLAGEPELCFSYISFVLDFSASRMSELRFDTKLSKLCMSVSDVVRHLSDIPVSITEFKLANRFYDTTVLKASAAVISAIFENGEYIKIASDIMKNNECVFLHDLNIRGGDVLALVITKPQNIAKCLDFLLTSVIKGFAENTKSSLEAFLCANIDDI